MATLPKAPSPTAVVAGADKSDAIEELFQSISIDDEDSELIDALHTLSKKSPKLVRSTEYKAPADPSILVRSWKMNEFKYYDIPSPFPTLARGLFTQEIKTPSGKVKHRVVARGYDKFFNIGEVPWTTWGSLESHTAAPYTLTLKSNGCIIFIAALTPTKLLVTSKHAIGSIDNESKVQSHAQVGERWLRKHLADCGKTEEQLAQTLWERNWTAVAELCDDSFEEHVLPYGPEKTGLHLHGLNSCTKRFQTQNQDVVDAFAKEWGFISTASTVLSTIPEVKAFTEEIGRTGSWNGEPLEGFVVRTHVTEPPTKGDKPASASPYPPGSSFFFKVKFDEPYLMYREWREVTKMLLSKGPSVEHVPKSKLRRPETKVYVEWVCAEIKRDRSQFADFAKGKGIIATRERFLGWMESKQGRQAQDEAEAVPEETGLKDVDLKGGKVIIVPVAVPGVGKTTVAVALAHLFGFGHVQSDDVRAKKAAPVFIRNVIDALKKHDVVIADKNNHLKQHRSQLRDAAKKFTPPAKLLALNWSFDLPLSTIHRICGDRILERGARHQSLVADAQDKAHEEVVWQFLKTAEELAEGEADVVAAMDVKEPLEDALARAVGVVVRYLGVPQPDVERMGKALAVARAYEPLVRGGKKGQDRDARGNGGKDTSDKGKAAEGNVEVASSSGQGQGQGQAGQSKNTNSPTLPRYFGILAEVDLPTALGPVLESADVPEAAKQFWTGLRAERRVQARPHVTLAHSKSLAVPMESALWERCRALHALARPPLFSFRLGHVVWNERVMAVTVVDLAVDRGEGGGGGDEEGEGAAVEFLVQMPEEVRTRLHITVGTRDASVPAVEAKDMVLDWKRSGDGGAGVWAVPLKDVWVKGRVKGLNN